MSSTNVSHSSWNLTCLLWSWQKLLANLTLQTTSVLEGFVRASVFLLGGWYLISRMFVVFGRSGIVCTSWLVANALSDCFFSRWRVWEGTLFLQRQWCARRPDAAIANFLHACVAVWKAQRLHYRVHRATYCWKKQTADFRRYEQSNEFEFCIQILSCSLYQTISISNKRSKNGNKAVVILSRHKPNTLTPFSCSTMNTLHVEEQH